MPCTHYGTTGRQSPLVILSVGLSLTNLVSSSSVLTLTVLAMMYAPDPRHCCRQGYSSTNRITTIFGHLIWLRFPTDICPSIRQRHDDRPVRGINRHFSHEEMVRTLPSFPTEPIVKREGIDLRATDHQYLVHSIMDRRNYVVPMSKCYLRWVLIHRSVNSLCYWKEA